MKKLYAYRKKHLLFTLPMLALLFLLAACGSSPAAMQTHASQSNSGSHGNGGSQGHGDQQQPRSTPTPQPTTVSMPPTQTSCPAPGRARGLVTEPLALGNHQNLVYVVNEVQHNASTLATLKRYDVVTGNKTVIIQFPNTRIDSPQISADGQWVLFVSATGQQEKLQAVRLDGQGLQTLYCSNVILEPQWSSDQHLIAFQETVSGNFNIYLLHTSDGTIEKVFTQSNASPRLYLLRTWLDNTHLYLIRTDTDRNSDVLSILDITKGDNQTPSDLKQIVSPGRQMLSLGSFDSSYDGTQLFVNHNGCSYGCAGPSDITVQPAQGGKERTIYSSQQYAVTDVRAVTPHILLVAIDNEPFGNSHADLSHNGLWAINSDGTGLIRLTTNDPNNPTYLNNNTQFPWSNVSRDGTTYAAVQISDPMSDVHTYTIIIGSLSAGKPYNIASISGRSTLDIAGWTTM